MKLDHMLAVDSAHHSDLIFDSSPSISAVGCLLHECFDGYQSVILQVLG
jgi:hypothetical protein